MIGRDRRLRQWLVDYPRALPTAIFLLVAAITALSIYSIERGEDRREISQLRERAQAIASAVERRGNATSAYLRAGAALFATRDEVSLPLFREFVNELRLDSDYRGAEGIGWAPAIAPRDVASFEESMVEQAPGTFRVFPEPSDDNAWVVPVTYLLPDTERSRRALGFDMYSELVRRQAMDEAVSSTRPTASGKVVLAQEGEGEGAGFLIYMPVFRGFGDNRVLRGFIYSPFNAEDLINSALALTPGAMQSLRFYEGSDGSNKLLAEVNAENPTGRTVRQNFTIANRPMTLELESAGRDSLSALSMLTLIFGLLVASLLMIVVRLLTQQVMEDRASLDWLEEQNSIRDSLTRELNHRVKNSLANVLSLIALTRRRTGSKDEFISGLEGRIRSLSATHDLLTQSDWATTPMREILAAELATYADDSEHGVFLSGPPVELAPNDALSFGLAIHELATNAGKFGALSVRDGEVHVEWSLVDDRLVEVVWREAGGPELDEQAGRARGFGMDLIEKIVAQEFDEPVEMEFAREGLRCTIRVPVRRPSDFAIRAKYRKKAPA